MGKVMRHTLGASLNIRHNLSSSKGPKPLQLKLLTTYIPKTSAFRSEERFSRNAETDLVCRLLLEKKKESPDGPLFPLDNKYYHLTTASSVHIASVTAALA